MSTLNRVVFDAARHVFLLDGVAVNGAAMQGVADSLINETNFRLRDFALRLQRGEISLSEWYVAAQDDVLSLHAAQHALAHGGIENMTAESWERAAKKAEFHLERLRACGEDLQNGRYGAGAESGLFPQRMDAFAEAGRASYENEQAFAAAQTRGETEAKRVLGAGVQNCENCESWAAMGWTPIDEMLEQYPIGASSCNVRCHCIIITR